MQLYYHTLLRFRFNWKLFWFFELIDHIDWLFCAFLYFEKLDRKVRMVSAREQNRLCQSGEGNGNEMVQRNRERECQTLMSLLHGRVYYYAEWWENGNGMNETWDKHGNARRRRKIIMTTIEKLVRANGRLLHGARPRGQLLWIDLIKDWVFVVRKCLNIVWGKFNLHMPCFRMFLQWCNQKPILLESWKNRHNTFKTVNRVFNVQFKNDIKGIK